MQTDAATPNIVGPTMLGVVASVLAVVCKSPTYSRFSPWYLQCILGRIQPTRLCKREFDSRLGPDVAPPMLEEVCKRIAEQKKCWALLAQNFDRFKLRATRRNNMRQGVQTDATFNTVFSLSSKLCKSKATDLDSISAKLLRAS